MSGLGDEVEEFRGGYGMAEVVALGDVASIAGEDGGASGVSTPSATVVRPSAWERSTTERTIAAARGFR